MKRKTGRVWSRLVGINTEWFKFALQYLLPSINGEGWLSSSIWLYLFIGNKYFTDNYDHQCPCNSWSCLPYPSDSSSYAIIGIYWKSYPAETSLGSSVATGTDCWDSNSEGYCQLCLLAHHCFTTGKSWCPFSRFSEALLSLWIA